GDGRADSQSPIRVLIEAQDLPTKGHPQSHQQKKNANDPGELPRKLVSPEEEDLHHVNENDGYHEVRAPAVQGANEPAERDVMIQGLETAPCFAAGWNVNHRKENSGDELQNEDGQRSA